MWEGLGGKGGGGGGGGGGKIPSPPHPQNPNVKALYMLGTNTSAGRDLSFNC